MKNGVGAGYAGPYVMCRSDTPAGNATSVGLPQTLRRRSFLAVAAFPLGLLAAPQETANLAVWVDSETPTGFFSAMFAKGNRSNLGGTGQLHGSVHLEFIGTTPVQVPDPGTRVLIDHGFAVKNLKFAEDFHEAMGDGAGIALPAEAGRYALSRATSRSAANITIVPEVMLTDLGTDAARMTIICSVDVSVPGMPDFDWRCHCETVDVRPYLGSGSWTDVEQAVLVNRVRAHVPTVLELVLREVDLRKRGAWVEPADPARMVKIGLKSWRPTTWYMFTMIGESETHLFAAMAPAVGLGVLKNRYAIDKRLLSRVEQPPG